jgi:hypothetical protein
MVQMLTEKVYLPFTYGSRIRLAVAGLFFRNHLRFELTSSTDSRRVVWFLRRRHLGDRSVYPFAEIGSQTHITMGFSPSLCHVSPFILEYALTRLRCVDAIDFFLSDARLPSLYYRNCTSDIQAEHR